MASVIKCMVLLRETLNLYPLFLSIYWVLARIYLLCNKVTDIKLLSKGYKLENSFRFLLYNFMLQDSIYLGMIIT